MLRGSGSGYASTSALLCPGLWACRFQRIYDHYEIIRETGGVREGEKEIRVMVGAKERVGDSVRRPGSARQ